MKFSPIAIVGQSVIFPGAQTPNELWQVGLKKEDILTTLPSDFWFLFKEHVQMSETYLRIPVPEPRPVRVGLVAGFEQLFNPEGFAISSQLVQALDLLFQYLLHIGREALLSAGYTIERMASLRAGAVFGSVSTHLINFLKYADLEILLQQVGIFFSSRAAAKIQASFPHDYNAFMSGLPAHILAQALQLQLGAFSIDAACASALYAIKLACDRLHNKEADLMLAAAVNMIDTFSICAGFAALEVLSPTGQTRPLHQEADGLLPSMGGGCVVLKRLEDALAAEDRILGIIRGVGLANDGFSGGVLLPDAGGQITAMQHAYQDSGLSPTDIDFLECHATGTPIGDQVELQGMKEVYTDHSLEIAALKANLGHSLTAAGMASLIRLLKGMEFGIKPSSLVTDPISELKKTSFRLLEQPESWKAKQGVRRGAINAFGFGGNNAHLVVEYWQESTSATYPLMGAPSPVESIAIVGMAVVAGSCQSLEQFREALSSGQIINPKLDEVAVTLKDIRLPPKDLEETSSQQLLMWTVVSQILTQALATTSTGEPLKREKISILIGMQQDIDSARVALRNRILPWIRQFQDILDVHTLEDPDFQKRILAATAPKGSAARTLGCMPNILTNRMNVQWNCKAPSFSVLSEELSGLDALKIAINQLNHREADAVIVGAVDLSCNLTRRKLACKFSPDRKGGDAAIALMVKRLPDALKNNDPIYATVSSTSFFEEPDIRLGTAEKCKDLTHQFGYAHCAVGLLHVCAGALLCDQSSVSSAHIAIQALGDRFDEIFLKKFSPESLSCSSEARTPESTASSNIRTWRYPIHAPHIRLPHHATVFSRQQLEQFATGKVSACFGPLFDSLDQYTVLVRLPASPLMLIDRVTKLIGEPKSLKSGSMWTETEVAPDQWYLHQDRMYTFAMAEAGGADLLLVSWLGIDFVNQGQRKYRLLGCEVEYHGDLPQPGDRICYEVHLSHFIQYGTLSLAFFYFDCWINGEIRMRVRNGQAGFFSEEELANPQGVIWNPASESHHDEARIDPPVVRCSYRQFSRQQLEAFAAGDMTCCFGPEFEKARAHQCSPKIPGGQFLILHQVLDLDYCGGPHGQGYIRGEQLVRPDDWFFSIHFKNDPCMPGSLMLEGAWQLLSFYLTACGVTLDKDHWRFEPARNKKFRVECRGQVTPATERVNYELFIREFVTGARPLASADLLVTVGNIKICHANLAMCLVPPY